MDYRLPRSSVHGIFQAKIVQWVAISFSRGSSWPRDWTWVCCISGGFFTVWATREVLTHCFNSAVHPCQSPVHTNFYKVLSLVFQYISLAKSTWHTPFLQLSSIICLISQIFFLNSRSILLKWTLSISTWKFHRHPKLKLFKPRFLPFLYQNYQNYFFSCLKNRRLRWAAIYGVAQS